MKQSELPKCPTCGNAPEYALKTRQHGWQQGNLKCPHGCHAVYLDSPAGNRREAENRLAPQWIELVGKVNQDKAS